MLGFTVHLTYPGLGLTYLRLPSLVLCLHFIDEDTRPRKLGWLAQLVLGTELGLTPGLYDFQAFVFKCCSSGEQLINLVKLLMETWDVYSH